MIATHTPKTLEIDHHWSRGGGFFSLWYRERYLLCFLCYPWLWSLSVDIDFRYKIASIGFLPFGVFFMWRKQ